MRILHINCNYIGTTLHQLMIERLDKTCVENEVFVPTYNRKNAVIIPNKNVYVSECFEKWDRVFFDYKQSKIIRAIEEYYDVRKFDIIHAYTLFTDGNVARILSKKYGVPYVVAIRNTDVNDFFKKMIFLRNRGVHIMEEAKKIFFLSNAYRKTVFDKYIPNDLKCKIYNKTEIIPNGIDDFWINNLFYNRNFNHITSQISEKRIKLLYVGVVDKNKNITLTCNAIDILKNKGWSIEFTVVGKIKDQSLFKKIESKINYIPMQSKEKLISIYRDSDIFVMPSITETFGLVYAEAMSQGLPVIYTKGQGFDEQFDDGYIGFNCSSYDAGDLAEKIVSICKNYRTISENCYDACRKFNWDDITKRYLELYKD